VRESIAELGAGPGPMPSEEESFCGTFSGKLFTLAGMEKTLRLPNCEEQAVLHQVQVRLVERAELENFKQLLDEHH
jgi:hypothetical protein